MKKNIIIAAILLLGSAAFANAQQTATQSTPVENQKSCTRDCPPQECSPQECDPKQCAPRECTPQECASRQCPTPDCRKPDCRKPGCPGFKGRDRLGQPDPFEGITLTPEQQSKITKLKTDAKARRMKKADKDSKDRKKEREKMDKELAKILTPGQLAQYNQNRAKAKELRKSGKPGKTCPGFKGKACKTFDKRSKGDCRPGNSRDCKAAECAPVNACSLSTSGEQK